MKLSYSLLVCWLLFTSAIYAQTTGKVLVITDTDADVIVDGDKQGTTTAGNAFKLELTAGEHYVQAQGTVNGKMANVGQTVNVESGKQQIIKLNLLSNGTPVVAQVTPATDTVNIANVDFTITGAIAVGLWMGDNPDQDYPDYPVYYYVFDKDDVLLIDFKMDNKKGTNVIAIESYPDGNDLYTDQNLVSAKNLTVKIPAKGIYSISYATNHALDRSCNMRVRKIPASPESKNLSPAVGWTTRKDTVFKWVNDTIATRSAVQVQAPEKRWINSTSNETFKGGSSRVTVPFTLPANTVEWYYIISCDRTEATINSTMKSFSLLKDVTAAVDATGVAGFSIGLLTTPPGADYCDVFLLDNADKQLFEAGEDFRHYEIGSRTNVMSSLVKVTTIKSGTFYLGFRNNDFSYGESVAYEIVAVTESHEIKKKQKIVKIQEKKLPVMPG